jgi:hypothetical protein
VEGILWRVWGGRGPACRGVCAPCKWPALMNPAEMLSTSAGCSLGSPKKAPQGCMLAITFFRLHSVCHSCLKCMLQTTAALQGKAAVGSPPGCCCCCGGAAICHLPNCCSLHDGELLVSI